MTKSNLDSTLFYFIQQIKEKARENGLAIAIELSRLQKKYDSSETYIFKDSSHIAEDMCMAELLGAQIIKDNNMDINTYISGLKARLKHRGDLPEMYDDKKGLQ